MFKLITSNGFKDKLKEELYRTAEGAGRARIAIDTSKLALENGETVYAKIEARLCNDPNNRRLIFLEMKTKSLITLAKINLDFSEKLLAEYLRYGSVIGESESH